MSSSYDNRWRVGLWIAFGLFILSRVLALTAFPIFNDESIYLQYSQLIHDNWDKNKYISMNGEFVDWKPPLQYWITAPFIDWGSDPLMVGRAVACLISIAGFFGVYLFGRELFTEREGVFAALLYAACPPVLLHNDQFTAETFLFSTAPLLYWALLKAMRPNTRRWGWLIASAFFGTALLLFKQSGFPLLAAAALLPLTRLQAKAATVHAPARPLFRNLLFVIAVIACANLTASLFLPSQFDANREEFDRKWVMTISELFAFPAAIWRTNLKVVADYVGSYYGWIVFLLLCGFAVVAPRRKNMAELTLLLMCLVGAIGVTFLLRGFNEYLFNTAVIATLLPLLARQAVLITDFVRAREQGWMTYAVLAAAALSIAYWGYQDVLMIVSPGKYLERSSRWAETNYLKSWSTGFGVNEIIALLEKEKRPGIVFADTQWGNPRTALEVYQKKRFPNLRIVEVTREFLDRDETRKLRNLVTRLRPAHYAVYSADSFSERRWPWETTIAQEMCDTRTEIKTYPSQMPIVVCQF
jgi:4-amino-4-deoxy-L-arabinose transferase-like glycosyltransferase